ncbi:unnamed protein product [Calypogeia fissa]
MAVLRVLTQRSAFIVGSRRPSNFAVRIPGRELQRASISTGVCGTWLGSLSSPANNARLFLASTNLWELRLSQCRLVGAKGRRTTTTPRCNFSARTAAAEWKDDRSPYETLEVERDAEEDEIKSSYRRLAKQFHPDVYSDDTGGLKGGESPEAKFIKIQAAYELLMDKDQRRQYDMDHGINPMKASKAWMEWVLKKKKAFEQRGDMAASVWAEQQQREMSLKARRLAKYKMDPEEERRILAKEKIAMTKNFETTLNRHTLVLKKRDLQRRKDAEEAKKKLVQQLLAAEGLELDDEKYS